MKSLSKLALCLLLAMSLTVSAFAAQVPDSLVAENLNGLQRLVKTYTLSPEVDPDELKEEDFSYDGYSSQLYPDGEALSSQDNAFHAAVSFGLCEDTCAGTDIITRGEAADLLYALLTGEFTVAPPPILETIPLNNKEGVHLNSYLLELQKIPEPIRQAFAERGWQYTIDYEYLARLSEERNMSCIGATNYGSRQITVSSAGATVHEFGHFLDELMGFPSQTEGFYQEESGTAAALLRPYALTNEREYFADCFVYWLTYRDNSKKMAALCSAAPKTYAYLLALESQNWQPAA